VDVPGQRPSPRRFYLRHGFTEAERTDGQRNDEREPDIRYVWKPRTQLLPEPAGR
jgi:hypothetical protein